MKVEIKGAAERRISELLASGEFESAEEAIAEMARVYQPRTRKSSTASALDGFRALGVIGCMKDGPADLATNPDHMEGFGSS